MYQNILIPTDGSVGTAHVALQAIDLAEQYEATLHVLHVVDETIHGLVSGLGGEDELNDRARHAVKVVKRIAEAHGVDVVTAIEVGDPAETIIGYAEEIEADLVVAGTHGRTGVERRLIGSVAEQMVRRSPCPVMTVRLPETDVTIEDEQQATEIATGTLESKGIDAVVVDVDRQQSVWVVDAEGDDESYLIYVDPVTQRTSVIS